MPIHRAVDNPNFILEIDFRLNPLKDREFNLHLNEFKQKTAGQPRSHVYENIDRPGNLLLVFEWITLRELEAYMGSDAYRIFIGGMETLGTVSGFRTLDLSRDAPEHGGRYVLRKRGLTRWSDNLR